MFKDLEFLGWYTTGGPPDQSDIHVHKQVSGSERGRGGGNTWRRGALALHVGQDPEASFSIQVCEIIESPLFLKLNPMTKHTDVSTFSSVLPIGTLQRLPLRVKPDGELCALSLPLAACQCL